MVEWYVYAIASAVFATAFALFRKRALQREHALEFESARSLAVFVLLLLLIPFVELPESNIALCLSFILALVASGAILFMSKAYRHSQISQIYPLQNIKPLFVVILAALFLGETVTKRNLVGIGILLLGAYAIEADHHFSDLWYPIKYLFKSKYNLYFVGAIFVFSITSLMDKYLIANYFDPISLLFLVWLFIALILNFYHAVRFGTKEIVQCFKETKLLPVAVALFSILGNLTYLKALTLAQISLVSPVRLLSTLFVVFIGGEFFHEKNVWYRVAVSAFMIVGVYFIIT